MQRKFLAEKSRKWSNFAICLISISKQSAEKGHKVQRKTHPRYRNPACQKERKAYAKRKMSEKPSEKMKDVTTFASSFRPRSMNGWLIMQR